MILSHTAVTSQMMTSCVRNTNAGAIGSSIIEVFHRLVALIRDSADGAEVSLVFLCVLCLCCMIGLVFHSHVCLLSSNSSCVPIGPALW